MPSLKKAKKNKGLIDRRESSGLSAFIERPVPTEKEVAGFERVVEREARAQEIESHLSEIYRDKNGDLINVQKMAVRRKHFWRRLVRWFFLLLILGGLAYAADVYFMPTSDISALSINISAPDNVQAGQPFSYQVSFHNPTKFVLSGVDLEMQYPANFIFASASQAPTAGNYSWSLPAMAPGATETISISGQLISLPDSANIIAARLSYLPGTFSTQFTKQATASTIVSGPGFDVDLQANDTAFISQPNDMSLIISNVQANNLGDFNLTFSLPSEATAGLASSTLATSTPGASAGTSTPNVTISKIGGQSWQILGVAPGLGRQEIPLYYQINQKSASSTVTVRLEKQLPDGQSYVFWEKSVNPEVVSSDLNLVLSLNGSTNNGALNFGQTLNYSLQYNNLGTNTFKDVAIMASLSGDFLDWGSLKTDSGGLTNNQTLIWTKQDLPALDQIAPGQSGTLNFTINLKPFSASDLGKALNVVSYAQYSVNDQAVQGASNKSNTISSLINSDLSFSEQLRYFDTNNTPVGSGPLPPAVGQTTSVRVYWTVKNNLHELSNANVIMVLPPYVSFNNTNNADLGALNYDPVSRQVTWTIGRMPVSVYQANAAFTISVTPTENDRNKILVLSPGSTVSALDTETQATITQKSAPKTTKLEDDDIAGLNNSGIVK